MATSARVRLPGVFAMLQERSILGLLVLDVPPFALSVLIANAFFKFGSFALEAVGFAVVWLLFAFVHEESLHFLRKWVPWIPQPHRESKSPRNSP